MNLFCGAFYVKNINLPSNMIAKYNKLNQNQEYDAIFVLGNNSWDADMYIIDYKLNNKQDGGGGVVTKPKKEHLSMAKKAMLEKERQRVVDAYRALKADKISLI